MTRAWRLGYRLAGVQFLVAGFHFAAIAPISPKLELEWGLQPIEIGLLSSILFYAYGVMQIPAGILADLLGSRRMLTLSGILVTLGAGLFGIATNYFVAVVGRLLLGVGTGMVFTGGVRHIASATVGRPNAGERFTVLLGPFAGLNYLGVALGSWPLVSIVGAFGWRAPLLIVASVSAILSALTWVYPGERDLYGRISREHILAGLTVWRTEPTIWMYTVIRFLYGSFVGMQTLWVVPFLSVSLGFGQWLVGLALLVMALGQSIGPILGSWLTKRSKRPLTVLKVAAATYAIGCVLLLFISRGRPEPALMMIAFCVLAITQTTTLVGYGLVSACVDGDLQATVIGMVNVGPWLGTGVFQLLVGYMVQGLWDGAGGGIPASSYSMMLIPLGVAAVMALPLNWLLVDKSQL